MVMIGRRVAIAFLMTLSTAGHSYGIREASFEAARIYNKRDPQFPEYHLLRQQGKGERWRDHIGLRLDTTLINTKAGNLYWDQIVVGNSTDIQYRETYWEWELGINISSGKNSAVDIFHHHKSEHALDLEDGAYPVEDYYGIRICFWGKECQK